MPRTRVVSGKAVAKGSGIAIGGLLVSLVIEQVGEADTYLVPGAAVCAVTGTDGGFRVPFPIDEWAAIEVRGDDYLPKKVKPGDGDLVVEMEPDLPVTGIVRRADGKPACLATVGLRAEDDWTSGPSTADTDGRFILRGVPAGEYQLVVTPAHDDLEPLTMPVRAGAKDVEVVLKRVSAAEAPARSPGGGSAR